MTLPGVLCAAGLMRDTSFVSHGSVGGCSPTTADENDSTPTFAEQGPGNRDLLRAGAARKKDEHVLKNVRFRKGGGRKSKNRR